MWRWIQHHTTVSTIGQVEILVNEPYSNGPGPANDGNGCGQFTHKVYHIGRYKVLQAVDAMNFYFSLVTKPCNGLNISLSIFAFVFTWLKFSIRLLAYDQNLSPPRPWLPMATCHHHLIAVVVSSGGSPPNHWGGWEGLVISFPPQRSGPIMMIWLRLLFSAIVIFATK